MVVAMAATRRFLVHPSIAGGHMGMLLVVYGIPVLSLALYLWAVAARRLPDGARRVTLVATIVLTCGLFALLRTEGITGEGRSQFAWRWSESPEQRLLAHSSNEQAPLPAPPKEIQKEPPAAAPATLPAAAAPVPRTAAPKPVEWPGFRGPERNGIVTGTTINTDWNVSRPVELWRKPVGPAWSSFAVGDGVFYTQEQRGEFEVVSCYDLKTGEPVWAHRDNARFWESNAGAGPRATPTLHNGRVYTFGATGILNALDAAKGAVVWTRNAASDTGAKVPPWGFASSPLVVDDMLLVAASGYLGAYDLSTGKPRWMAPNAGGSYSSPHLLTIGGVPQIVLLSSRGATGIAPTDGSVLWKHLWEGVPMLQPALTADGGLLITTGDAAGGMGTRRLAVAHGPTGWTASEVWTSRGLKPYFNDYIVHAGHAFGFDGSILSCIDLQDGSRKWKGGRYGHGQMLLLREQNLLLVLSEEGELALVAAVPGGFSEVAKVPALEGKTWNHPVLVGDVLLVRNGQEMAAFRLTRAGS
jgi:outer membrane protein assembly factor BamB